MKSELDDKLCKDFPKLFRNRYVAPEQTCMYWGFEVSDSWEPLIRECAAKLEAINNKIEDPNNHIVASQVKSKFGGLRFYLESYPTEYDAEVSAAIAMAENKADETCENCGQPGSSAGSKGWIHTLCVTCREERNKK